MAVSVQRGLGSSDREAAVGLASSNPFDPLRNYLHLGLDRSADAGDRFRSALDTEGASVLCAVDGGVLRGVAVVAHDERLSQHFGFGCASVRALAVDRSEPSAGVLGALAAAMRDLVGASGERHLSVRAAADDFEMLTAFQSHGFLVADTMVTHLLSPTNPQTALPRRDMGKVEVLVAYGAEIERLPARLGATMTEVLRRHYVLSRFHADPLFDDDRAGEWYAQWCERAFSGSAADGMMVAVHDEQPMGFISWSKDHAAEKQHGLSIFGSGLGASLGRGAYAAMVEFAAISPTFAHAEFDVHVSNFPVNRVLGRHPASRLLRVSHALHLCIGQP